MKVTKIRDHRSFGRYMQKHLPSTLMVKEKSDAYGWEFVVKRADSSWWDAKIATIGMDSIHIFDPVWFDDLSDWSQKYEKETGNEISLSYHES